MRRPGGGAGGCLQAPREALPLHPTAPSKGGAEHLLPAAGLRAEAALSAVRPSADSDGKSRPGHLGGSSLQIPLLEAAPGRPELPRPPPPPTLHAIPGETSTPTPLPTAHTPRNKHSPPPRRQPRHLRTNSSGLEAGAQSPVARGTLH